MIRRIAITGPESTGKSVLSEALASFYQTVWAPEYARSYINTLGRPYTAEDILLIAKGQIESEEEWSQKANNLLFCDTELIVAKIWCEYKYGFCHDWIIENIEKSTYELILLCDIDLPWIFDKQREHPDLRQYFFELYKKELMRRKCRFEIVSGIGDERLYNAVHAVNKII